MTDAISAPVADIAVAARIQNNHFAPVVQQCVGCGHVRLVDGVGYCQSYAAPAAKWSVGICNFATHSKVERAKDLRSLNPLKASKRGGK